MSKYSKELLENIVKESTTMSEVCRKLNLTASGGNSGEMKKRLIKYGIDFSHFTGKGSQKGKRYKKKSLHDIFTYTDYRVSGTKLREALLRLGREYVCEWCGIGPEYNGRDLTLDVDHIDGDFRDNSVSNLRFLCPNCHSQTPTHGYKNVEMKKYKEEMEFSFDDKAL